MINVSIAGTKVCNKSFIAPFKADVAQDLEKKPIRALGYDWLPFVFGLWEAAYYHSNTLEINRTDFFNNYAKAHLPRYDDYQFEIAKQLGGVTRQGDSDFVSFLDYLVYVNVVAVKNDKPALLEKMFPDWDYRNDIKTFCNLSKDERIYNHYLNLIKYLYGDDIFEKHGIDPRKIWELGEWGVPPFAKIIRVSKSNIKSFTAFNSFLNKYNNFNNDENGTWKSDFYNMVGGWSNKDYYTDKLHNKFRMPVKIIHNEYYAFDLRSLYERDELDKGLSKNSIKELYRITKGVPIDLTEDEKPFYFMWQLNFIKAHKYLENEETIAQLDRDAKIKLKELGYGDTGDFLDLQRKHRQFESVIHHFPSRDSLTKEYGMYTNRVAFCNLITAQSHIEWYQGKECPEEVLLIRYSFIKNIDEIKKQIEKVIKEFRLQEKEYGLGEMASKEFNKKMQIILQEIEMRNYYA